MYTYAMLSFGFGLLAMTVVFSMAELFSLLGSFILKHIGEKSR